MIRKGFFGAAPPSQQVPCDLRPSRLSVHPSVHPSPYPDSAPGSTGAIGGTKKDRNHQRGSQTIAGTRNEPLQTVPGPLVQSCRGVGKSTKGILRRKAQISRVFHPAPAST